MRGNKLPVTATVIGALALSVALAGCDLLINKPETDLEKAVDAEIAWANAARLAVEVYVPESWGRSPQFGPLPSGSARQGFPFALEFTVSAAYGFTEWRAYRTADLGDRNEAALNRAAPLGAEEAAIESEPGGRASVTIHIAEAVTLIPWCEDRPRITQSNPPLINSGISYTRGQQIKLWFAGPLDPATVQFGEGFIEISGQFAGETGEPYNAPETAEANENGDLTGRAAGTMRFFKAPAYDEETKTVTISPEAKDGETRAGLPPGDIVITVTVGVKVLSPNGNGMASPVSFYYRTNTLETKNVYTAENIWAVHKPGETPGAEQFFYTGADTSRDRRLRKNASGKYEVTLYFRAQAGNPAEMTDEPNRVRVAELHYANLAGGSTATLTGETPYAAAAAETGAGTAGAVYRENTNSAPYKITYQWDTEPQPGIIRLIVLPYRDTDGDGDYTDAGDFAPDTWGNAQAEGRFVAVVLDNQPPSGTPELGLSGEASVSGGVHNYSDTGESRNLHITANFSNIVDNAGYGIRRIEAFQDKPWTMDEPAALSWQWRIVTGAEQNWPADNETWHPLSETTQSLDLSTVSNLDANTQRTVQVRFKDSLGNIATANEGWITMGTIVYYTPAYTAVSSWDASYNEAENTITVTWTTPADMAGVEFSVNGGGAQTITGTGSKTHTVTGVPKINSSGVLSGQSVTGVTGYTITLTAYNAYGRAAPTPVKIWNIPGMSVSSASPAVEISTQAGLAAIPGTGLSGKSYVLVNDIALTGIWTPIGNDTNAFKGKFYGNGHTITFETGAAVAASAYRGLFGYTDSALIRDLTVKYANSGNTATSAVRLGGVAGYAAGTSQFENIVLLSGGAGDNLSLTQSGSALSYMGGLAGVLESSSRVKNCYSTLNLSLIVKDHVGEMGGLVGKITSGGSSSDAILSDVEVRGNIRYKRTTDVGSDSDNLSGTSDTPATSSPGQNFIGGVAGMSDTGGKFVNCAYSAPGQIRIGDGSYDYSRLGTLYLGGICGASADTWYLSCYFTGKIAESYITLANIAAHKCYIGGIAGLFAASLGDPSIDDAKATGNITVNIDNLSDIFLGGVAGGMFQIKDNDTAGSTHIVNSSYETGTLTLTMKSNDLNSGSYTRVGGLVGRIINSGTIEGSHAGGTLSITCENLHQNLVIGGFMSFIEGSGGFIVKKCSSSIEMDIDIPVANSRILYAGGFTGELSGNSSASLRAKLDSCFTTGNITATMTGAGQNLIAGGFAGRVYYADISNCYALGKVVGDNKNGARNVYTGGLAGEADHSTIKNSFAGGVVEAHTNGNYNAFAGGLVGNYISDSTLSNCAALGTSVTATSTTSRGTGRVYGGNSESVTPASSKNYAWDGIVRRESSTYKDSTFSGSSELPTATNSDTGKDGADATIDNFRSAAFWLNSSGLSFNYTGGGMGGITKVWDFSGVAGAGRGYPILAGLGGQ